MKDLTLARKSLKKFGNDDEVCYGSEVLDTRYTSRPGVFSNGDSRPNLNERMNRSEANKRLAR
jgi:hypothetical protein